MASYYFNPFPVLETSRLQLRRLRHDDAEKIFMLRSDPVVNKHLNRPKAKSIEDASAFINKINFGIENHQSVFWAIDFKDQPGLVGTICLWHFSDEENKAEIGYELLPQYHGKGIMQEAIARVIQYAFEIVQLQKIEAWTVTENIRSIGILERSLFKRDLDAETKIDRSTEGNETIVYSLQKLL